MGKQKPHEVQQKCMQDLGWNNPMQQQTGRRLFGKQLSRKGPVSLFSLKMMIVKGDLHCCLQLPDQKIQRKWSQTLLRCAEHSEKKRQQAQLGIWEIPIRYKEKYFYHESSEILEQASRKTLWNLYPWRCSRLD